MRREILCTTIDITYNDHDTQQKEYTKNAFSVSDNKMYKKVVKEGYCIAVFYLDSEHKTMQMDVKGYSKVFNAQNEEEVIETYLDEMLFPEVLTFILSKTDPITLLEPDYLQLERICDTENHVQIKAHIHDLYEVYAEFDTYTLTENISYCALFTNQVSSRNLQEALRYILM